MQKTEIEILAVKGMSASQQTEELQKRFDAGWRIAWRDSYFVQFERQKKPEKSSRIEGNIAFFKDDASNKLRRFCRLWKIPSATEQDMREAVAQNACYWDGENWFLTEEFKKKKLAK